MKTRYTFLYYIINMTCASTAFAILVGIGLITLLGLAAGESFLGIIFGLFFAIFPAIFGFISGFVSSLILSLVAFIFFDPENISGRKFLIVSFGIIAAIILAISGINYISVAVIFVLMAAHYFARQYLVVPIKKRKSKNNQ